MTLRVYDLLGREVAVLVDDALAPGTYAVQWNAGDQPSGIYFYRITAAGFTETKRMALVR